MEEDWCRRASVLLRREGKVDAVALKPVKSPAPFGSVYFSTHMPIT